MAKEPPGPVENLFHEAQDSRGTLAQVKSFLTDHRGNSPYFSLEHEWQYLHPFGGRVTMKMRVALVFRFSKPHPCQENGRREEQSQLSSIPRAHMLEET